MGLPDPGDSQEFLHALFEASGCPCLPLRQAGLVICLDPFEGDGSAGEHPPSLGDPEVSLVRRSGVAIDRGRQEGCQASRLSSGGELVY